MRPWARETDYPSQFLEIVFTKDANIRMRYLLAAFSSSKSCAQKYHNGIHLVRTGSTNGTYSGQQAKTNQAYTSKILLRGRMNMRAGRQHQRKR